MAADGLGGCIRTLRLQRQMTGTELARRCQVTKGLISQIERGVTVPSLDVLARIASALDVSMAQLLEMCNPPPKEESTSVVDLGYEPVVRRDNRTVIAMPKVNQVYESLTPTLRGQIEFSILRIGPLDEEQTLAYTHQGEECLLVLEGAVSVSLGGRMYHLEEGDSMAYPASIPHSYRCEGSSPAVVVMAETPPAFFNFLEHHISAGKSRGE
jgi:transcriptional regulator with XRE-family HTH domain